MRPLTIFDEQAAAYDAWYDTAAGQALFQQELEALRPLVAELPRPWLEVGVGTGRFGAGLGVDVGIDPSLGSLAIARRRLRIAAALGEALPFPNGRFGAVVCVLTLCFVADPLGVLREIRRVLRPYGALVLGTIPADSPLGEHYRRLGSEGHHYYRHARFFFRGELDALLEAAGFRITRRRSALAGYRSGIQPAGTATEGDDPSAGFRAVLAVPESERPERG